MNRKVRSAAAVLAGGLLAVVVIELGSGRPSPVASSDPRAPAASGLLDDWERWRRAEVVLDERTVRRNGANESVESVTVVQRWPDRFVRSGTSLSARLGSRMIGCTERAEDGAICLDRGGFDPVAELDAELAELRRQTSGRSAPYRVVRTRGGCYRLRHQIEEFRPAFGERVDYCFDIEDGVLISETTVSGSLTVSVRRSVRDRTISAEDLELPGGGVANGRPVPGEGVRLKSRTAPPITWA